MMAKIISWVVQNSDSLWSNTGPWAYSTLWLSGSVNFPKLQVGCIIDSNIINMLVSLFNTIFTKVSTNATYGT